MKNRTFGCFCWLLLAYFIVKFAAILPTEIAANAQEIELPLESAAKQLADSQEAAKVRILFPENSIANWKSSQFGGDGVIRIENETLVLGIGDPLTGVTYQGEDLPRNFYEVTLEARRLKGHDFFCCLTFPVDESHCSLVVGGWAGTIVGLSCLDGRDASDNETTREMTFANETWFPIRVRVTPGRIAAWIGDEQVVDADVSNKTLSVRNEVVLSRPLGVCSFRTEAEFRNIRLQIIDEDKHPRSSHPSSPQ